ncbi:MAG: nucleotidyltransferase family protein [Faecousia sp.]
MRFDAKVSEYLLALLRCALNGATPDEKPEDVAWESVFSMAKKHGVSALGFYAIKKLKPPPDAELMEKWDERNAKLMAKCVNQETEFSALTACFEEHEIPFLPLKGSVVRELFPLPHLREMGDIDILVPVDKIQKACELAQSMNYKLAATVSHHVELQKRPYMNLELHTGLIAPTYEYYEYYKDPWKRAYLQKDKFWYGMKNEDVYLYLLTHAAKHYYYSGTGIRSVIDIYLFNRAYRSSMNQEYIAEELKKLNLATFAAQMEGLAEYWFSEHDCDASADIEEMQAYILSSATYGTKSIREANELRRYIRNGKSESGAKTAMFLHMVFLPCDEMQLMFPILKKAPILLPFCWVARWFRILFTKPQSISSSYKKIHDIHLQNNDKDSCVGR